MEFRLDSKGKDFWLNAKKEALRRHAAGEPLTLDETAAAMWNPETADRPMTSMGILKIEKRALLKLKSQLKKRNIVGLDDLFESKFREYATPISSIYSK